MNSQAIGTPKLHRATMVAIIVVMWVIGMFGEHVQTSGGLGWDGQVYARLVRDLPTILNSDRLPAYYGHRLIPIALVHAFSAKT